MRLRYWYLALFFTFLLGCRDGFIALWKNPAEEPVYVFPYSITSLPPADQRDLKKGIPIESGKELAGILEDYLS